VQARSARGRTIADLPATFLSQYMGWGTVYGCRRCEIPTHRNVGSPTGLARTRRQRHNPQQRNKDISLCRPGCLSVSLAPCSTAQPADVGLSCPPRTDPQSTSHPCGQHRSWRSSVAAAGVQLPDGAVQSRQLERDGRRSARAVPLQMAQKTPMDWLESGQRSLQQSGRLGWRYAATPSSDEGHSEQPDMRMRGPRRARGQAEARDRW